MTGLGVGYASATWHSTHGAYAVGLRVRTWTTWCLCASHLSEGSILLTSAPTAMHATQGSHNGMITHSATLRGALRCRAYPLTQPIHGLGNVPTPPPTHGARAGRQGYPHPPLPLPPTPYPYAYPYPYPVAWAWRVHVHHLKLCVIINNSALHRMRTHTHDPPTTAGTTVQGLHPLDPAHPWADPYAAPQQVKVR